MQIPIDSTRSHLDRHLDVTPSMLLDRLFRESDIRGAGSFYGQEALEKTLRMAMGDTRWIDRALSRIDQNHNRIATSVQAPKGSLSIGVSGGKLLAREASAAEVVIQFLPSGKPPYFVLTAYPTFRQDDPKAAIDLERELLKSPAFQNSDGSRSRLFRRRKIPGGVVSGTSEHPPEVLDLFWPLPAPRSQRWEAVVCRLHRTGSQRSSGADKDPRPVGHGHGASECGSQIRQRRLSRRARPLNGTRPKKCGSLSRSRVRSRERRDQQALNQ